MLQVLFAGLAGLSGAAGVVVSATGWRALGSHRVWPFPPTAVALPWRVWAAGL